MKLAATAAALVMAASVAQAADFQVAGQTLSLGTEFDMNYTTGVDAWALDTTPSVGATVWGLDFELATTFDMLDIDDGMDDLFQGVDLSVGYDLTSQLGVYGEVSSDDNWNFGDVKMGVTFAF